MKGIRTEGAIIPAVYNSLKDNFTSIGELFKKGMTDEATQVAALRMARRLNTEVAGAIQTESGIAINPNKRSMLQGPGLRNFRFTFKMIPTSEAESNSIKEIVKFFRSEMYPTVIESAGIPAALNYPSEFDIKLNYRTASGKAVQVGTGILPCFLQGADVAYNNTSAAFHHDGNVQEVDLTLNFIETRTLSRDDIVNGM